MDGASEKHRMICQFGACGRARRDELLTSGLDMLAQILGSQLEWISCWNIGRKPIRTSMDRHVTTKGDIFLRLSSQWIV